MSFLAIAGGSPVKNEIGPYSEWPLGNEKTANAAADVLKSGIWGTLGPKSAEFAQKYAEYTQSGYCIPVSNGTVSLEIILRALGIGRGDEVIIPPYTFTATVSAVIITGAMPVFADINPDTYTIDPESVENAVTSKTRAIIGVHLGGRPFDMDKINAVAKKHNLYVIEDAAHAHGSEWAGKRVGSVGDAGSFSFQESKNLPSGEGGAITTNNKALYEKLWSIHNNGRSYGESGYFHVNVGTNSRMGEWQAAMLCEGLERLDSDIERRMENAAYLDKEFKSFPFLEPMKKNINETRNSYHLYLFKYKKEELDGIPREVFLDALGAENVCSVCSGYSSPIYETNMMYGDEFKKITGRKFINPKKNLPNNETAAYSEGMWIYHSSLLGEKSDMDAIIEAVGKIYKHKDELKHRNRNGGN